MKTVFLTLACLMFSVAVQAQTVVTVGPLTGMERFAWEAPPNVTTVADAQTFEPRLYLDAVPATALTGATCVIANNAITCSAPVGASQRDALNMVGSHAITLALFRQDVGEGPKSSPFALRTAAGAPTGLRIIR